MNSRWPKPFRQSRSGDCMVEVINPGLAGSLWRTSSPKGAKVQFHFQPCKCLPDRANRLEETGYRILRWKQKRTASFRPLNLGNLRRFFSISTIFLPSINSTNSLPGFGRDCSVFSVLRWETKTKGFGSFPAELLHLNFSIH